MYDPPNSNQPHVTPAVADRLSDVLSKLRTVDAPLGMAIWEIGRANRIGEVIDGIRGTGNLHRHIRDGHQYVGIFPANLWKTATRDETYRTLSFGIKTFTRRWNEIKKELKGPLHYVSIGPGTGEKDRWILEYLQSFGGGEDIVYIPVDISSELLRLSLDETLPALDLERVSVIPIQLDITDEESLRELKEVLAVLTGDAGMIVSVLGNTLANFQNDRQMLTQIASLLSSPEHLLLLELATVTTASAHTAGLAAAEYQGSNSFRQFAIATLRDYTNCTLDGAELTCDGQVVDDFLQITTSFMPSEALTVTFRNGDHFVLDAKQMIELYKSRKYTATAQKSLLAEFNEVDRSHSLYASRNNFGVATMLLRRR